MQRQFILAAAALLAACGGGGGGSTPPPAPVPSASAPASAAAQTSTLRSDLSSPWGLARLPDGRWLVTERGGRLWLLSSDASTRRELTGLPAVVVAGQGGLLDVAVDPDFAAGQPFIYWSYAEGAGGQSGTAVARAQLLSDQLGPATVIFRQQPKVNGGGHFGARLVFGRDKTLFITLGDRQLLSPAQDLQQTLGKVARVNRDGSIPTDNPAMGARPGVWSYGHRNPQGAALHPETGELWVSEHGPQGGDEINIARAGRNYGWPLRSYGCNYGDPVGEACRIGGGVHAPGYEEPLSFWVPTSIAPSNLVFYAGSMFPEWQGSLLMGALAGEAVWRLSLSGNQIGAREIVLRGERFRDLEVAPDGSLWLLTDSGKLLRHGR
jgi:aldose sugar dehydrogenase